MVSADFSLKRICLQTLLWSRLLPESRCDNDWTGGSTSELGFLGLPTSDQTTTITITITIGYKPTAAAAAAPAPGDSTYFLLGCYSQVTSNSGGTYPFGQEGSYAMPPTVPSDKLTPNACLEGCAALNPSNQASSQYEFIGLSNGNKCVCGSQLGQEARKLPIENCNMPCIGDASLSCGGADKVAVYSVVAAGKSVDSTTNVNSQDENSHSEEKGGQDGSTLAATHTETSVSSSATDATAVFKETPETLSKPAESLDASKPSPSSPSTSIRSPAQPDADEAPASGSAIAVVTGCISAAIILTALGILCVRAYKRKKQQQNNAFAEIVLEERRKHNASRLSQRPVPGILDTAGYRQDRSNSRAGHGRESTRGEDGDISLNIISTPRADFVPSTPALESGTRLRHPESHSHPRTTMVTSPSENDSLYHRLMDEVRAGPAVGPVTSPSPLSTSFHPPPSATSSAVQWRGGGGGHQTPMTPSSASVGRFDFEFTTTTTTTTTTAAAKNTSTTTPSNKNNAAAAAAAAAATPPNLSVPSPTPAARPESTLGDRAWHRRKLSTAFQPPTSGPPSIPLPPTPPRRQQQQQQQQQRGSDAIYLAPSPTPTMKARAKAKAGAKAKETAKAKVEVEGGSRGGGGDGGDADGKTEEEEDHIRPARLSVVKTQIRGPAVPNAPAKLASPSSSAPPMGPPPMDLPAVPRAQRDSKLAEAMMKRAGTSGGSVAPPAPTPVMPANQMGTIYTVGEADWKINEKGGEGIGEGVGGTDKQEGAWPREMSTSTIATSILFPEEEEEEGSQK